MLHLYISSSELFGRYRITWIVWAMVFCAFYIGILPDSKREIPDGVLTIFQEHRVTGEDYLLRATVPDTVIVGSSLSALLPDITLHPVYNLALSGGSMQTGMQLIVRSGRFPRILFVETNVLLRDADETLLGELLNPFTLWVKTWCLACRTRNQPVTLLLSYLSWMRAKQIAPEERDQAAFNVVRNEERFQELLRLQLQGAKKEPDPVLLQKALDKLASLVARAEQAGVHIVFVEMPMDAALNVSAFYRGVSRAAHQRFPDNTHSWITFTKGDFRTSDGMHLLYPEARRVAYAIAEKSRNLMP